MRGTIRVCLVCERERRTSRAVVTVSSVRRPRKRKPPRPRVDPLVMTGVVAAVRAGTMTVAEGARDVGCDKDVLYRRCWTETKADVVMRDGGVCVWCGGPATDVHHRTSRGAGGSGDPVLNFGYANLTSLCRSCHSYTELHPQWARTVGLRVDRGIDPTTVPIKAYGRFWTWLRADGTREMAERDTG